SVVTPACRVVAGRLVMEILKQKARLDGLDGFCAGGGAGAQGGARESRLVLGGERRAPAILYTRKPSQPSKLSKSAEGARYPARPGRTPRSTQQASVGPNEERAVVLRASVSSTAGC